MQSYVLAAAAEADSYKAAGKYLLTSSLRWRDSNVAFTAYLEPERKHAECSPTFWNILFLVLVGLSPETNDWLLKIVDQRTFLLPSHKSWPKRSIGSISRSTSSKKISTTLTYLVRRSVDWEPKSSTSNHDRFDYANHNSGFIATNTLLQLQSHSCASHS